MILVDTSVWIDHLRVGDEALPEPLRSGRVLAHPFVIGERALGNLRRRKMILALLHDLPQAEAATMGKCCRSSNGAPSRAAAAATSTPNFWPPRS